MGTTNEDFRPPALMAAIVEWALSKGARAIGRMPGGVWYGSLPLDGDSIEVVINGRAEPADVVAGRVPPFSALLKSTKMLAAGVIDPRGGGLVGFDEDTLIAVFSAAACGSEEGHQ